MQIGQMFHLKVMSMSVAPVSVLTLQMLNVIRRLEFRNLV